MTNAWVFGLGPKHAN
jgi:hypothetical protein